MYLFRALNSLSECVRDDTQSNSQKCIGAYSGRKQIDLQNMI